MMVELAYFEGCPHWQEAEANLLAIQPEFGFDLAYRLITTPEEAEEFGFRGSPSIVVDGEDLFASAAQPVGMSCRRYATPEGPAGRPTIDQLRRALRAAEGEVSRGGRT